MKNINQWYPGPTVLMEVLYVIILFGMWYTDLPIQHLGS